MCMQGCTTEEHLVHGALRAAVAPCTRFDVAPIPFTNNSSRETWRAARR
jgi:hypothetical protein